MLAKNYKERMKVEDICNHPWIMRMEQEYIKSTSSSSNSNTTTQPNPKQFELFKEYLKSTYHLEDIDIKNLKSSLKN